MRAFSSIIDCDRLPGHELSKRIRDAIIAAVEGGMGTAEAALQFNTSQRNVQRTIKRWNTTGGNASKDRSGRPNTLSRRQKRLIFRIARKTPKIEYHDLLVEAGLWLASSATPSLSAKTVQRALAQEGLHNFRAKRRPKITQNVAQLRLKYAQDWEGFNYKRVTIKFSDECSIVRGSGRSAEWVFRYPNEKFKHKMVDERTTSRGKAQMVWGAIWVTPGGRVGRSPLVLMTRDDTAPRNGYTARSYCQALEEGLIHQYKPSERFMQDNAKIHVAKLTKDWLESHGIWTIEHPPYSPDLNPIEHMWWALKRTLHKLHPEFDRLGDTQEEWGRFCEGLKEAWLAIPDTLIRKLIHSMTKRLEAVSNADGYQTKY